MQWCPSATPRPRGPRCSASLELFAVVRSGPRFYLSSKLRCRRLFFPAGEACRVTDYRAIAVALELPIDEPSFA
jgi:hypothetical protein